MKERNTTWYAVRFAGLALLVSNSSMATLFAPSMQGALPRPGLFLPPPAMRALPPVAEPVRSSEPSRLLSWARRAWDGLAASAVRAGKAVEPAAEKAVIGLGRRIESAVVSLGSGSVKSAAPIARPAAVSEAKGFLPAPSEPGPSGNPNLIAWSRTRTMDLAAASKGKSDGSRQAAYRAGRATLHESFWSYRSDGRNPGLDAAVAGMIDRQSARAHGSFDRSAERMEERFDRLEVGVESTEAGLASSAGAGTETSAPPAQAAPAKREFRRLSTPWDLSR